MNLSYCRRVAGRRSELAALTAAAQHVAEGRGSTVILVGEPGIGKSYLLASFAAAASELGIVVCSGSAYELEQRRPFGVLLDAFGVRPGVEDGRRARVAARLHDHVAGGDLTVTGYWIGEELLAVIDEMCTQRPVALVVDDLQWVDSGSLALLARIARMASHQRILVVLSVRPAHRPAQVTQLVTGIVAAGGQPLAVGPLSDDEVAELTAEQVGAPPGDSLWNLLRRTGGSPLFVRELIAGLRAADALRIDRDHVETDETRIPNSVSVAVRHHLTQLDPDTIEVLRLAAVLCGPFTLAQLGHITGRSSVELYPCLRAALEAGILGDDGSRLRFTHEVIRATLYGDIPQAVRVGLHRDIARALTTAGAPALEVAEHYLRGATAGDRDAVHGLRQAAVAIAGQSPAEAADLVERAAALLPVTDAEQALLTLERARYLTSAGRAGEAESLCRELLRSTNDLDTERSIRMILADVLVAQSRLAEGLNETQRIVELTAAGTADHSRATANLSWALLSCSTDTVSVTVPARELQHILAGESGANTLITLDVDGKSVLTLARQIHRHPTKGILVHVDFIRIDRDVAVSAEIPIHLVGEATGVKDGGLLEQLLFHLTVEAMPGNIPVSIEIDVERLAIGDQLRVEDISLPTGVETQAEADFVIAQVARRASPPRRASRAKRAKAKRAKAARLVPRHRPKAPRTIPATSNRCCGAGAPPPTCWWWGSGIPATSTRARVTTWGPRSSRSWPRAMAPR